MLRSATRWCPYRGAARRYSVLAGVGTATPSNDGQRLRQFFEGKSKGQGVQLSPNDLADAAGLSKDHWNDINNQRQLFDAIGKALGVRQHADWYWVPRKEVASRGGWRVFQNGGHNNLEEALRVIYPEYPWQTERFLAHGRAGRGFWRDKKNRLKAIDMAEVELGIRQPEDWHSVTMTDLNGVSAFPRISKVQLADLLKQKYPDREWEKVFLMRGKYSQQRRLEHAMKAIFPLATDMIINARKEAGLINRETGEFLELDVFLPSLKLAIEYQEKHHYIPTQYHSLEIIQQRDEQKRSLVLEKGITLINVPCWWDGTTDSLMATIKKERPDLLLHIDNIDAKRAISETPPPHFLEKQQAPEIEDIGIAPIANFFTMSSINPENWWIFEKYDGVRAFWNPTKKAFYSRLGNKFNTISQEVIDSMPDDTFMDGELWFGRDTFAEAMKISGRAESSKINWGVFKYMVFDIPNQEGTYGERYAKLEEVCKKRNFKYVRIAPKEVCRDTSHMEFFFQDVLNKGGEGIILRDPSAPYQAGKSAGFLKHKKFRDAEAKIVRAEGQYQWECELPNGVRFFAAAGTTAFAQRWAPKEGDIVTFKHHGFLGASGKPKFPSLHRIRTDMSWDDVVHQFTEPKARPVVEPLRFFGKGKLAAAEKKPKHYWSDIIRQREFLESLKPEFGILKNSDWYRIPRSEIAARGGSRLVKKYPSMEALVKALYPNELIAFPRMTKKELWSDIKNCRQFLDEFAKRRGFDPQEVNGWYSNLQYLQLEKGIATMKNLYGGWMRVIVHAYPTLTFERWPMERLRQPLQLQTQ